MTGGQGWLWVAKTRRSNSVSQDSVGLRNVARKLKARKRKADEEEEENRDVKAQEAGVKRVKEEKVDELKDEEDMEVDKKPVETVENSGNNEMKVDAVLSEKKEEEAGSIKTEDSKEETTTGERNVAIDIMNTSPVKPQKVPAVERSGKLKNDSAAAKESSLPPKADVDLINVSKGMNERTFYVKVTKPYAKLDSLLMKRLKQEEIEIKQRQALQQQINWKLKAQVKSEPVQVSTNVKQEVKTEESKALADTSPADETPDLPSHPCYSYLCRSEEGSCYSCLCLQRQSQDEAMMNLAGNSQENASDAESDEEEEEEGEEEEDVDVEGDGKLSPQKSAQVKEEKVEVKKEEGEEESMDTSEADVKSVKSEPEVKLIKPVAITPTTTSAVKVTTSNSSAVVQLLAQKSGVKANQMTQAQLALRQAIDKMSVEELRSKMPPVRATNEPIKLVKFAKLGQKVPAKKKATLPSCHKFLTPSGKKTLFALEKFELRKLSRKGGKCETKAFNYNCKMNNVNWIYPCPRPVFRTAWRYRTQTCRSYGAVGVQLRILWACLRWDDLSVKPPAGGTNTISTETEITTKELLKRRDVGPHNLRSEFLVRKIVVPLGVPSQPKGTVQLHAFMYTYF